MSAKSWPEIKRLLDAALDLDPAERSAFLERACRSDVELRSEIESYLNREAEVEEFIEKPLVDLHPKSRPDSWGGQRIGTWRLVRCIGRGGMGLVYLGRRADDVFEQQVAVKLLKRGLDSNEIVQRFENERQILANLEHPHIARVVDGGCTEDGLPYFVMEYVEGQPIDRYRSERNLHLETTLKLFRTVCETVHFAHQNLIVHCDLKPANILITAEGFPKLLDFGIAKLLRPDGRAGETRSSWRFGTPKYASPEQERGQALTTASDVYSLGMILQELLDGQSLSDAPEETPFQVSTAGKALRGGNRHPAASDVRSRHASRSQLGILNRDLETIVRQATNPEPKRRYDSAAELSEDLRRFLAKEPITARPNTLLYRSRKLLQRHPLSMAAVSAVVILIFSFIGLLSFQLQATQAQRDRARLLRDAFLALLETIDLSKGKISSEVASEALEQALETELSSDRADRALLLDRMGRIYYRFGRLGEARRLLEQSLTLRRGPPVVDESSIASSLNNLGLVLIHQGQVADGIEQVQQALDIHSRLNNAPAILHALTNLATGLEKSGRYSEAEDLYRQVLEQKRELQRNEDEEWANSLNNLASVLIQQNKLEQAEPLLREALAIYRRELGDASTLEATVLVNLAVLLDARQDFEGSIDLARQALIVRRKHFPENDPNIARARAVLAFSLLGNGGPDQLAEAEEIYREALDVHLIERGPYHPNTLVIQRNLAVTLIAQGKPEEAEPLASEVVERSIHGWAEDHWRIADARSVLGHSQLAQDRFAEAESLVLEAYTILRNHKPGSRYAREARERIFELYRSWGREEEARTFLEPTEETTGAP